MNRSGKKTGSGSRLLEQNLFSKGCALRQGTLRTQATKTQCNGEETGKRKRTCLLEEKLNGAWNGGVVGLELELVLPAPLEQVRGVVESVSESPRVLLPAMPPLVTASAENVDGDQTHLGGSYREHTATERSWPAVDCLLSVSSVFLSAGVATET